MILAAGDGIGMHVLYLYKTYRLFLFFPRFGC